MKQLAHMQALLLAFEYVVLQRALWAEVALTGIVVYVDTALYNALRMARTCLGCWLS